MTSLCCFCRFVFPATPDLPRARARVALWLVLGLMMLAWSGHPHAAQAQGFDPQGRPISAVEIEGLRQVPQTLVRNQIRMAPGQGYDRQTVEQDIVRITHLGRFASVQARVDPQPDGSIVLSYVVEEHPLLSDVLIVGNKAISDQQLAGMTLLRSGDPIDPFLIDRAKTKIRQAYEDEGYFLTEVEIDPQQLEENGILLFKVREGPKLRIRDFRFTGNETFADNQLRAQVRSRTYFWLIRDGALSRQRLDADVARIRQFYIDRGYLDVQVGRRIELSPDHRNAIVVFMVDEGRRYIVTDIVLEGNDVFSDADVLGAMALRIGGVFSQRDARRSVEAIQNDLYGKLGYLDTQVIIERRFHESLARVAVIVRIEEGEPSLVGNVSVRGNEHTKDKVILRQIRGMTPGRRFDREGIATTERRLSESAWFETAKVTLVGEPGQTYRDVLIEVKEKQTGSVNFGAAVSSDAGLLGAIDVTQRNFDIADWPESFEELVSGRAFRGAGQYFALNLTPGVDRQRYSITFREPYLLESDIAFEGSAFFFTSDRQDFDEARFGGVVGLGKRFGDVWSAFVRARFEAINIDVTDDQAPVDVFDVEGNSYLSSLGVTLSRNTTDSRVFPTRGNVLEMSLTRTGAFGGDYQFTTVGASFRQFWTIDEDFLGRRSVLSLRVETSYIIEDGQAPVFERLYAGGHRTFRGFSFRGIGPVGFTRQGAQTDQQVGGDWMFLLGLEYSFPLIERTLRGVIFTDTGTVQADFGMEQYRVSIGAGLRLSLPFFGQTPLALDFAFPLVKEETDDTRIISFSMALPF